MRLWHEHQRESFRLSELSRRPTPRRPRPVGIWGLSKLPGDAIPTSLTPGSFGVHFGRPGFGSASMLGQALFAATAGLWGPDVFPGFGDALVCFQGSLMVGHGMSSSRCVMSDEAARFINHNRRWPPFGHARCVLRCVFGPSVRRRCVGKSDASSEPAAAEESESPTETDRPGRNRLRRSRGV